MNALNIQGIKLKDNSSVFMLLFTNIIIVRKNGRIAVDRYDIIWC